MVRIRDVIFNEYETFNGDLETLKDDMLKIRLDELSKLLQQCTIPEESEEEMLVQLAQEEPGEIRNLAEDKLGDDYCKDYCNQQSGLAEDELGDDYYNDYYNQQSSLAEDKIQVYKTD